MAAVISFAICPPPFSWQCLKSGLRLQPGPTVYINFFRLTRYFSEVDKLSLREGEEPLLFAYQPLAIGLQHIMIIYSVGVEGDGGRRVSYGRGEKQMSFGS